MFDTLREETANKNDGLAKSTTVYGLLPTATSWDGSAMSRHSKEVNAESSGSLPDDRLAAHKKRTREIVQNRSWVKKYTNNYNFDVVKNRSVKGRKKRSNS